MLIVLLKHNDFSLKCKFCGKYSHPNYNNLIIILSAGIMPDTFKYLLCKNYAGIIGLGLFLIKVRKPIHIIY